MNVTIKHVQKTTGWIWKATHHGVAIRVKFDAEEQAVIEQRRLQPDIVLERDFSSDLGFKDRQRVAFPNLFTRLSLLIGVGAEALHTHLTIAKLLSGTDVFYLDRVATAKEYEATLRASLEELKGWIAANAEVVTETAKFEV